MVRSKAKRDRQAAAFERSVARQLRPFVDLLTHEDDGRRREALAHVLRIALPPVLRRIVGLLVRVLEGPEGTASRQAAASLADMGEVAAPALRYALLTARSAQGQVRLAEVLGVIGRALSPRRRVPIQLDLAVAEGRALSLEAAAAITRISETLHPGRGGPGRARAVRGGGRREGGPERSRASSLDRPMPGKAPTSPSSARQRPRRPGSRLDPLWSAWARAGRRERALARVRRPVPGPAGPTVSWRQGACPRSRGLRLFIPDPYRIAGRVSVGAGSALVGTAQMDAGD
jgi:hypothetical protein